jgi:hypothetical protein
MPYIGNQPQYTSFLTDTFSGNGLTTVFNMRIAPANAAAAIVAIWGILQDPLTYSVIGNILTFSQAPPAGTDNISVRYLSLPSSNVVNSAYRSVTDITATAGQTTFSTSSYTPGFVEVFRNGVRLGVSNYTATSGVTIVLGNPANAGDLVTVVSFFVSSVINAIPGTAGAVTANNLDTSQQGGVGAMALPTGSTGQRPITPANGMIRKNTTTGLVEHWDPATSSWVGLTSVISYDVLVVGGGGGTGYSLYHNGGGGGGGTVFSAGILSIGQVYTVTVGAGGTGGTATSSNNNTAGNPSQFGTLVALGGGKGGTWADFPGGNGASGGGGAENGNAPSQVAGLGTAGQGFNGGAGGQSAPGAGGGGGAGGVGGTGVSNTRGGLGGVGLQYTISGTATFYGGGGGGANYYGNSNAAGGTGGGGPGWWAAGSGATASNGAAGSANGTPNTGGGAGGYERADGRTGGIGGSGIVILRIPSAYTATFTPGLTTSLNSSVSGFKIYSVTAGTGSVTIG